MEKNSVYQQMRKANLQCQASPLYRHQLFAHTRSFIWHDLKEIKKYGEQKEGQKKAEVVAPPTIKQRAKKLLLIGAHLNQITPQGHEQKEKDVEELIQKMLQAMKLSPSQYIFSKYFKQLCTLDDDNNQSITQEDCLRAIKQEITKEEISLVVTFGASATHLLLQNSERLSLVHGKFIDQKIETYHYQVMPLFHPEFLLINPNMKRTAWMDMQKIMGYLFDA